MSRNLQAEYEPLQIPAEASRTKLWVWREVDVSKEEGSEAGGEGKEVCEVGAVRGGEQIL